MTKAFFWAFALEQKCTSATGIRGEKQYVERDCCVVNSCHLNVLIHCVSIFDFSVV